MLAPSAIMQNLLQPSLDEAVPADFYTNRTTLSG